MSHIKSYVKRLSETGQLKKLVPADVPRRKVRQKPPAFLTKEEMTLLFKGLEKDVATSIVV